MRLGMFISVVSTPTSECLQYVSQVASKHIERDGSLFPFD